MSVRVSQEKFEENADLVAIARRAAGGESFPDYFEVSRSMAEETEIPVFQEPVRPRKGKVEGKMVIAGSALLWTVSYLPVRDNLDEWSTWQRGR